MLWENNYKVDNRKIVWWCKFDKNNFNGFPRMCTFKNFAVNLLKIVFCSFYFK